MNPPADVFDPYETLVKKTLDEFIPFKVDWELTYRCNLSCKHCYQSGPTGARELSTEEIFRTLDQLAAMGCLYITFTGGEIMLREDLFEICGYAREKGFALRLFTNGTLVDEAAAQKIRQLNPLTVEISLYAADAPLHERITGVKGSFERTLAALRLLGEHKVNRVVKCTFFQDNAGQFRALEEFSRSMNAPFTYSFTVIPRIDGTGGLEQLRLNEGQLNDILLPLAKKAADEGAPVDLAPGGVQCYEPLCAAGFNSLYISPYGEVFPCVVLRQSCGNVREQPLETIWRAPVFSRLRGIRFSDLSGCRTCGLAQSCDRCAGLAWMESGDVLAVSPNDCTLARVRRKIMEVGHGKEKEAAVQQA